MEFDLSRAVTSDVIEFARLQTEMANLLIDRLERQYPRNMHEFFPRCMSPVPDTEFAATFGPETLKNVMEAAGAVCTAMAARVELEKRRRPN